MAQPPVPPPNDPFAALDANDGSATIIRPNPAAWAQPRPGGAMGAPAAAMPEPSGPEAALPSIALNPLLAMANKLLMAVPQIRATRQMPDPAVLRNSLAQAIRDFAGAAGAAGMAAQQVMAARYVLCTVLDEAASDTPWGGGGVWSQHSLLALFHNEAFGGEKVFQLMAKLAGQPETHRELLELIYATLCLGFEGRYRAIENGKAQVDAVRDKLARILRESRGPYPAALAQHWQTNAVTEQRSTGWLALLVAALVAGLLLALIYVGLAYSLGSRSDPVFGAVQGLRLTPPVAQVAKPAPTPRLAQFLRPDIQANILSVRDEIDRSVVVIRGDGLFEPGSATLIGGREDVMRRIAAALAQLGGAVLVTGHSDNQPIRTARFPSNWHLSEERARTVSELLASQGVAAKRLRAEGRADAEPVAPNDSPASRALNRRVEITLFVDRPAELGGGAAAPNTPTTPAAAGSRP